mmetsp:Transcript_5577/g.16052  ORF Transcript_5577/g.16052 Transcript_5577/m.16052 type:complete len:290 (+) Transcript_5577:322-1191(+)
MFDPCPVSLFRQPSRPSTFDVNRLGHSLAESPQLGPGFHGGCGLEPIPECLGALFPLFRPGPQALSGSFFPIEVVRHVESQQVLGRSAGVCTAPRRRAGWSAHPFRWVGGARLLSIPGRLQAGNRHRVRDGGGGSSASNILLLLRRRLCLRIVFDGRIVASPVKVGHGTTVPPEQSPQEGSGLVQVPDGPAPKLQHAHASRCVERRPLPVPRVVDARAAARAAACGSHELLGILTRYSPEPLEGRPPALASGGGNSCCRQRRNVAVGIGFPGPVLVLGLHGLVGGSKLN